MKRKKTGRLDDEFRQSEYNRYGQHYVCFACRKMFNQTHWHHWHDSYAPPKKGHPCPNCGAEMQNVGQDFKAPRQQNIKQWRKIEFLFRRGYRWRQWAESSDVTEGKWKGWSYYETVGGGPRARTLREAKDYPPRG